MNTKVFILQSCLLLLFVTTVLALKCRMCIGTEKDCEDSKVEEDCDLELGCNLEEKAKKDGKTIDQVTNEIAERLGLNTSITDTLKETKKNPLCKDDEIACFYTKSKLLTGTKVAYSCGLKDYCEFFKKKLSITKDLFECTSCKENMCDAGKKKSTSSTKITAEAMVIVIASSLCISLIYTNLNF